MLVDDSVDDKPGDAVSLPLSNSMPRLVLEGDTAHLIAARILGEAKQSKRRSLGIAQVESDYTETGNPTCHNSGSIINTMPGVPTCPKSSFDDFLHLDAMHRQILCHDRSAR